MKIDCKFIKHLYCMQIYVVDSLFVLRKVLGVYVGLFDGVCFSFAVLYVGSVAALLCILPDFV